MLREINIDERLANLNSFFQPYFTYYFKPESKEEIENLLYRSQVPNLCKKYDSDPSETIDFWNDIDTMKVGEQYIVITDYYYGTCISYEELVSDMDDLKNSIKRIFAREAENDKNN